VAVRSDLALRLADQGRGDAGAAVGSRDLHLVDFIVDDHDEYGYGSVDGRYGRVRDAFRPLRPERSSVTNVDELLRNQPEMAVLPSEVPDLRDVACVLVPRCAKGDVWTVRNHVSILRAAGSRPTSRAEERATPPPAKSRRRR
jgi:hypothetical protein